VLDFLARGRESEAFGEYGDHVRSYLQERLALVCAERCQRLEPIVRRMPAEAQNQDRAYSLAPQCLQWAASGS
jgi:hypothetical protein